jgi:hypothetical protein
MMISFVIVLSISLMAIYIALNLGPEIIYGKKHHSKEANPSNPIVSDNSHNIDNEPLTPNQETTLNYLTELLLMLQQSMKKKT